MSETAAWAAAEAARVAEALTVALVRENRVKAEAMATDAKAEATEDILRRTGGEVKAAEEHREVAEAAARAAAERMWEAELTLVDIEAARKEAEKTAMAARLIVNSMRRQRDEAMAHAASAAAWARRAEAEAVAERARRMEAEEMGARLAAEAETVVSSLEARLQQAQDMFAQAHAGGLGDVVRCPTASPAPMHRACPCFVSQDHGHTGKTSVALSPRSCSPASSPHRFFLTVPA